VFTRLPTSKWGVAVGSVVGGLSSLIILAEDSFAVFSAFLKIFVSVIIVYFSFFPDRIKKFLKVYFSFISISALFGGIVFFLELTFFKKRILYFNGTIYFDISIKFLLGCIFVIYGIFMFLNYFLERRANKTDLYDVSVSFRDVTVKLTGCIDNCNNLTDVLTGRDVICGELKAVSSFFSFEEINFFKKQDLIVVPESLNKVLRFVPCKTVSGDSLMPVFTPDKVEITVNGKVRQIKNVCIGIVNKSFADGEYSLLLNKNILE
jgi:stage II sporulation protein GA (sporulation sigma-E factor processing peptidase)